MGDIPLQLIVQNQGLQNIFWKKIGSSVLKLLVVLIRLKDLVNINLKVLCTHYQKFLKYSIGKGKIPPLYHKPWNKNESYWYF